MNAAELKKLIKEEIRNVLNEDAFRRIVITSSKTKEITKEIQAFVKRPEMKRDYPVKLTVKPGVKPNTVVVDISGAGATVMGTKLGDLAKKLDKTADIKTKKEIKRVPVNNESKLTEAAPVKLKLGEMYQVYDPGMDTWNDEYEYLGFDVNSREYMFKTFDSPVDYFHFVGITKNDLASSVKPSEM
jgi:hypothetical protein